jgi:opacity protein-like surface antigen
MIIRIVVSAMLLFFSSSINAKDSLSGFYIGGAVGYSMGDDGGGWCNSSNVCGTYKLDTYPQGASVGIFSGFNYLRNNLLIGLEIDIDRRDQRDTTFETYRGAPRTNLPFKTDVKKSRSLIAKFGYTFNDKLSAVYALAGPAQGKIKRNTYSALIHDNVWQTGWKVGVGIEHLFSKNLGLKANITHSDLGKRTFADRNPAQTFQVQYHEDAIKFGIFYLFDL